MLGSGEFGKGNAVDGRLFHPSSLSLIGGRLLSASVREETRRLICFCGAAHFPSSISAERVRSVVASNGRVQGFVLMSACHHCVSQHVTLAAEGCCRNLSLARFVWRDGLCRSGAA